ncbi:MAG TPA: hypothetical protein VLH38_02295 [Patescibacteria group bacterium]|nr:hypothetical protein [Patescibacteria group bacterium]
MALFSLALVCSIGLGLATHSHTSAANQRDCSHNSIDYKNLNNGCGAADPVEYVKDLRQNDPSDLQVIAKNFSADFHLSPSEYDDFIAHAVEGVAHKKTGTVTVGNMVVVRDAFSVGRDRKDYASKYSIPNEKTTYWASKTQDVFAEDDIPAMVYFDTRGQAQFVVLKPCGNVMGGTKVKNTASCRALNSNQPDATHKPNTYNFTATAVVVDNATVSRVVYHFGDDNSTITKTSVTAVVEHTFTKDATVTATIYATVPGGHEIQAIQIADCQKHITFIPAFYVCANLMAAAIDDQRKSFRFTVMVKTDTTGTTKLVGVDFTLDGKSTVNGANRGSQGNIYKDYAFTDAVQHTVKATVNFNTAQGVQSVSCQASITPAKIPLCTVPGHTTEAPTSPNCGYCQPSIPIGDARCTPPAATTTSSTPAPPLVNTGPGATIGLFGLATVLGFVGHKIFVNRRTSQGWTSVGS